MPLLRPLAWLLGLLLLIVALLAVFALTFDANRYKPEIQALVKEQTGRELTIDGKINLSFYPNIALQLGQVKLGNAVGFAKESFAEAENARVAVQFLPLLEQQLKINDVHLQGLKLNLHRVKSGKTNWQDLLPEGSSQATADAGEAMTSLLGGLVITGVSVSDSQVRWRDDQHGNALTLAPLNLQTGTFHPGKPVAISLDTNLKQSAPALDVHFHLTTTAQLADNAKDFSLANLSVQAQLPDTLEANISGNLQGNLDKKSAEIPDFKADINLVGQGTFNVGGQLDVNLAKQKLALAALTLEADLKTAQVPGGTLQSNASGKLDVNLASGKGLLDLPHVQLNLLDQALTGVLQVQDPLQPSRVVEGKFKTDQLSYPPFALQQATLGVHFADGQVKLTPSGKLFQGDYHGTINVDTLLTPPVVRTEHKVQKLRTDDLLFALTDDRLITGALDMTAQLDSVAGDAEAFKQNLNGNIALELNDGTIRDANFAQKTKEVVTLFEKEHVNALGEKEVAFTKLEGQWQVDKGVFHTEESVMTAPHFQVKGSGDVNIVNESLDVKLRISEKPKADKPQGLFAPLHIVGAWDKPSYALELDVLLKELAKSQLDTEKQKQMDALQQQRDSVTERLKNELQDEKQKLTDELKNQLKGLF
ncbi:AsmA family protein [Thiothrix fructosivorans]|uniref:AsmA family protein n=1 Tax=Thiothrix fructosivorans TaxID=111770 RepID=A0A8B0SKD1_9GAMM|nr:AsmA family protein [Thiothrix fructosivorans]MBO0613000.1 AsmA family protein [Thiothrix fructosivorans]QTX11551.1 AsmA family protein [Thiothrix fructosivorans]